MSLNSVVSSILILQNPLHLWEEKEKFYIFGFELILSYSVSEIADLALRGEVMVQNRYYLSLNNFMIIIAILKKFLYL